MVFAPGFVPRVRFESDLFPQLERFADEVIAKRNERCADGAAPQPRRHGLAARRGERRGGEPRRPDDGAVRRRRWLRLLAAGFEAALVGGLADWFAVTALFRHPLGLPIPHTAIIPTRRAKIIESIVSMVQDEWLSPEVIGARLARFAPSALIVDWLRDPAHVERLGGPLRDLLRGAGPHADRAGGRRVRRPHHAAAAARGADRRVGRAAGWRASRRATAPRRRFSGGAVARQPGAPAADGGDAASLARSRGARAAPGRQAAGAVAAAAQGRAAQARRGRLRLRLGGAAARRRASRSIRCAAGLFEAVERFADALGAAAMRRRSGRSSSCAPRVVESLEAPARGARAARPAAPPARAATSPMPQGYLAELVDRKLRAAILDAARRSGAPRRLRPLGAHHGRRPAAPPPSPDRPHRAREPRSARHRRAGARRSKTASAPICSSSA